MNKDIRQQTFNEDQLELVEWQYSVRHQSTDAFRLGEMVFLVSDPLHPMWVSALGRQVEVFWFDFDGSIQVTSLPPQCLLQYRYAGLQNWKGEYDVCLN